MGTIPRRNVPGTALPPAPAPTSRDANPWSLPTARAPQRLPGLRVDPARIPDRLKAAPSAAARPATPEAPRKVVHLRWMPYALVIGVLVAVGGNALDSFRRGDYIGAVIPMVIVGVIAFHSLRSLLRKSP